MRHPVLCSCDDCIAGITDDNSPTLKARAEKAEDGLDLIYSVSGQENGTPETVCTGIRSMRLKIDELIVAKNDAVTERDALKSLCEKQQQALGEIANHKFTNYGAAKGPVYEGGYGIGVVDGHRSCAVIARHALDELLKQGEK